MRNTNKIIVSLLYLLLFFLLSFTGGAGAGENINATISFTEAEKAWLQEHPVIRVANEMDWPPFDFNESGTPKGLVIDHIRLLSDKIGIKVEFIHGYTWSELVSLFKQRKIDVMPVFYRNDERQRYTLYTKPYYRGKLGVFTRTDDDSWNVSLINKRVGMEKSHGSIPIVKTLMPEIILMEFDTKKELVRKLATRQLDAIIGNPFVFYYIAKESQINNIQLSNFVNMTEEEQQKTSLHIGVRNDWPLLHQILSKAMETVGEAEMTEIERRWADVTIVKPVNWTLVFQVACVIGVMVFLLFWHNRKLKSMVDLKTRELKMLNDELEMKVDERTKELTEVNMELKKSIEELRTLRGILPICSACKKIRDDSGYWNQIDAYIAEHSEAEFSHGMCPECAEELYGDQDWYIKSKKKKSSKKS